MDVRTQMGTQPMMQAETQPMMRTGMQAGAQPVMRAGTQPMMQAGPQSMMQPIPTIPQRPDTEQTKRRKENFGVLGLGSLLYACFYTLCMYKAGRGLNEAFFLAGSLWFYCFCMKKLGISLKKDSIFYMISLLLLGVSTFCTADAKIINMNRAGIWVLTVSFLLHQFFEDKNWTFGRYAGYLVGAVFGSLGEITRPFLDMVEYRRKKGKQDGQKIAYVIVGVVVGIPVLVILWLLLMSADKMFLTMTEQLFENLDIANIVGIAFTVLAVFFFTYCMMSLLCKKPFSEKAADRVCVEALPAITVMLPVTVLYVVFCCVQIVCLFFGNIDLERYTYAEYARQGFFQLLAVCVINLVMVLASQAYFKRSKVLRALITVVSGCTYVMIASAAFRMVLYIRHYYLTFLRIFVLWSLAVIFLLLTGIVVSIYKEKFPLFRFSMVAVTVCYLLLSFGHPDYWIARCNTANMESSHSSFFDVDAYEDYDYMMRLSPDAAPVLLPLSQEQSWAEGYARGVQDAYEEMGIRDFNLSVYIAEKILQNY